MHWAGATVVFRTIYPLAVSDCCNINQNEEPLFCTPRPALMMGGIAAVVERLQGDYNDSHRLWIFAVTYTYRALHRTTPTLGQQLCVLLTVSTGSSGESTCLDVCHLPYYKMATRPSLYMDKILGVQNAKLRRDSFSIELPVQIIQLGQTGA